MPFFPTPIEGCIIFEPQVWEDHRGYFFESYNRRTFEAAGISADFVQDNQARSTYGVLRGLHFQKPPFEQAKLVRVTEGAVFDVAVDLRPDSPTRGRWYGIELSAENKRQLFVPRGFAHGYVVLSPVAEFCYKCDNFYAKDHDAGIRFDDPTLQIEWPIDLQDAVLSEKDLALPGWEDMPA
jgi:dTDP-4-dehydrorhamnose 3,5-epimerase